MDHSETSQRQSVSWWHWAVALILIAFSLFFIVDARKLDSAGSIGLGPGAVPAGMAILMLVLSVGYASSLWLASRRSEPDGARPKPDPGSEAPSPVADVPAGGGATTIDRPRSPLSEWVEQARGKPITYMAISFVSLTLVNVVGFYVALAVLTIGCCLSARAATLTKTLMFAAGIVGFTWLVFGQLLGIYYPLGALFE